LAGQLEDILNYDGLTTNLHFTYTRFGAQKTVDDAAGHRVFLKIEGVRHQWHLDKPFCIEKSSFYPQKKAGGLMAISRSVTEGNHRKQSQK